MMSANEKRTGARGALMVGLVVGAMLLAGCKTDQMKSTPFYEGHDVTYTGKPEDRVNLWPIAYWREPVGSVLWPMLRIDYILLPKEYTASGHETVRIPWSDHYPVMTNLYFDK